MLTPMYALALLLTVACRSSAALEVASDPVAPSRPRNVAILVYQGVELLDFAGPGEVFSAAQGPGGRAFHVYTVAKEKRPIESQGFVSISPEHSIADCPAPDIVVVPGGAIPEQDRELQEWVRSCATSAELVMSVCNGAFLLAEAGLLDGLEVTTHHGSLQALSARYPKTRVYTNRRFVDSGRVMTCAGVSAGIDGALHVVERLLGDEAAQGTARYMEYDWRPAEIAAQLAEKGLTVEDGVPFRLAGVAREKGTEAALAAYRAAPQRPGEPELVDAAYGLLFAGKKEQSLALFRLVAAAFPDSPDAHDSLAEACEQSGDTAGALQSSERGIALLQASGSPRPELLNSLKSRLVRLGRGDRAALRYACPPCGGPCDAARYVEAGPCPACRMPMALAAREE